MSDKRLTYLFFQYFNKTIAAEELDELMLLLNDPVNEQRVKVLMEETYQVFEPGKRVLDDVQSKQLFTRILAHSEPVVKELPVGRRRTMWWRMTAAAAVLLLFSAGFYWWSADRSQPSVATADNRTDVLPGGSKATLLLADGSTITLDSTGNQVIKQGNATINQYNGRLQYTGNNTATVSYNTLATPLGGQFRITLPDGSNVWLNSASSLRYPTAFAGKERVVELHGQGYFEIAQNANQPFKVRVLPEQGQHTLGEEKGPEKQPMEVQVLGTHFDIMAYADESTVKTTLLEGAVKVKQGITQATLEPGQQAVLNNASNALFVQAADINQVIAWKTGFFEFANTDLATIMRQVARWYDVEVVFRNKHPSEQFFGRVSRNMPLSHILRLLEENGLHFSMEGKKVTVL
ncbi:FecR domain-containing protein [Chitinophaga sp. MM2321]|uniref:FecR family protein n=1 Tax=Chitinophaga sp. MM2321 TaxID=3137178 RepID=UPI0032D5A4A4